MPRRRPITAPLIVSTVAAAWLATPLHAAPPRLEVGQLFPEIVLPAARDGRPMSIADFRGEKVVLHVFASW
jgi:hypothetical protein